MHTKLTLNIEKDLIRKAKQLARARKISLSKLVENYLRSLVAKQANEETTGSVVEELSGILHAPPLDPKKEIREFLDKKHFRDA
ncbi:MAG: hypothetical protein GXO24_06455 [Chlorobi bacterium]|jgi:hypothetical protein|nr:hypothetical protein [Chlorobiota bacterium]